jgi:hypothetical protein
MLERMKPFEDRQRGVRACGPKDGDEIGGGHW